MGYTQPTERQLQVLRALYDLTEMRGPTIRELGDKLGIRSTNGVNAHLKALERKGLVERKGMQARGVIPSEAGFHLIEDGEEGSDP